MKTKRQNKILEIIEKQDVETQEELSELLKQAGFSVTQATVSRDIRELKLLKQPSERGGSKYTKAASGERSIPRLQDFIAHAEATFDYAGNTVVVHCGAGMAQTLCVMLDKEPAAEEIVGTIAGDDTIFILMRTEAAAARFCEKFTV